MKLGSHRPLSRWRAADGQAAAALRRCVRPDPPHGLHRPQEDAFNLVKFYSLDRSLVYSILAAAFTEKLEFPFLPDEAEHLIISLTERRSVLLIGRCVCSDARWCRVARDGAALCDGERR